jgi:hypothetical protein
MNSRVKIGWKLAWSSHGWVTLLPPELSCRSREWGRARRALITFWSFPQILMVLPQYQGKLSWLCLSRRCLTRRNTPMTLPIPILASAFVLAGAVLLALRSAASIAGKQSTVMVRSDGRRPAHGRSK